MKLCHTVKTIESEYGRDFCFKLDVGGRIFKLQAESYADKEAWIGALGKQMVKKSVMIDPAFEQIPDF